MFKKLILSGTVASILATGAMAEDYMKDIYASIGSQGSYELGFAMDHSSNISSNWNYKNIGDKDLYKGAIYATNQVNEVYWGFGAGIIHSKMDETITNSNTVCTALGCQTTTTTENTTSKKTKPTINAMLNGRIPYLGAAKIEGYLADAHNLGTTIEFNVWQGDVLFGDPTGATDDKGIIPFVTVGVGADKIQGETEKSVFVKLHYAF